MIERRIETLEELGAFFAALNKDQLLRGQCTHYLAADGEPNITTSFTRRGCVPPKMLKWTHYASEALRVLTGPDPVKNSLELDQAILQHYGWRSFFIDVTHSPAVAAWFAANKFHEKRNVHMCADYEDEFVMMAHSIAEYRQSTSDGHIYVISKSKAAAHKIRLHDLEEELGAEDTTLRFHRQRAALLGITTRLPVDAIEVHASVPAEVLIRYAAANGAETQAYLFPSRDEDIILKLLLSIPWERRDNEMPIYARGLELPEYDFKPVRNQPANIAFYREFWVADHPEMHDEIRDALFFKTPDQAFYYQPPPGAFSLPLLTTHIRQAKTVVIESSDLIRLFETHSSTVYAKGIVLCLSDKDTVEVRELAVEHPGKALVGAGKLAPWSYSIQATGEWVRVPRETDCPCNNPTRHEGHARVLRIIEILLTEGKYRKISDHEYVHS